MIDEVGQLYTADFVICIFAQYRFHEQSSSRMECVLCWTI